MLYQCTEALFYEGAKIGIDGIRFENHHLVLHKELVEYVHWPDACHIACSEHEGNFPSVLLFLVGDSLSFRQFLGGYSRLHPDFCRNAREEKAVTTRKWEHTCRPPCTPVCRYRH